MRDLSVQYIDEPFDGCVARGFTQPGWYFWDEVREYCYGPYAKYDDADQKSFEYSLTLNDPQEAPKWARESLISLLTFEEDTPRFAAAVCVKPGEFQAFVGTGHYFTSYKVERTKNFTESKKAQAWVFDEWVSSTLQVPEPLCDPEGKLCNVMIKLPGQAESFRCPCGCNVFHYWDKNDKSKLQCNGCDNRYVTDPVDPNSSGSN